MYPLYYEGSKEHSLGTHDKVVITKDLRTDNAGGKVQTWSGRYGIPAEAKFSTSSSSLTDSNEYNGSVLIAFKIEGYKDGELVYNYVGNGQWAKERVVSGVGLRELYKAKEETTVWKETKTIGSVLVFNSGRDLRDEYIARPVWNE
jgi:hypothetical protein